MPGDSLEAARYSLRLTQGRYADGAQIGDGNAAEIARERAQTREDAAVEVGATLELDGRTYDPERERDRLTRTRALIDRVEPGPHEDGIYFEMLARQAASIEMHLASEFEGTDAADALVRIVFGTTGEPRSHDWKDRVGNSAAIAISAGTMESVYQLAKPATLSWPISEDGGLDISEAAVTASLDADATPTMMTVDTLGSWLFDGVAFPTHPTPLDPTRILALTTITEGATRFVLAHEYAHVLVDDMGIKVGGYPPITLDSKLVEIRADLIAMRILIESAALYDSVAPYAALQGALMAVQIQSIVHDMKVDFAGGSDTPSATHPSADQRCDALLSAYEEDYQAASDGVGLDVVLAAARTLKQLWERARPIIASEVHSGRLPHEIWLPPSM